MTFAQLSTIIFLVWMFVVAYLLYRHAVGAGAHARDLATLLARSNVKIAESNVKIAEAAHEAAEAAKKLADILEKKHAE